MVVYNGFDILDHGGPYGMFSAQAPSLLNPQVVAATTAPIKSSQGMEVIPTSTFEQLDGADVIWVPGGSGPDYLDQFYCDNPMLQWLNKQKDTARLICSVCTGAHIAAAAGLLNGYTCTTHWMFQPQLLMFPGITLAPGFPRYWVDRNRVTGGGVSSGLDESLAVIAMLLGSEAAMQAQLINQYAPDPPFNSGSPVTASPEMLADFFSWIGYDTQPSWTTAIEKYIDSDCM